MPASLLRILRTLLITNKLDCRMSSTKILTTPSESQKFKEPVINVSKSGSGGVDLGKGEIPGDTITIEGSQIGVLDIAEGNNAEDNKSTKLAYASSSVIKFYPEWCQCMECLRAPTRYNEDAKQTCTHFLRQMCICPPSGPTARVFTFILEFVLAWIFLWILLKNAHGIPGLPSPAHPRGPIFALAVLEILGLSLGILFKCFRLPSLLGPLILGIVLRNVDFLNIFRQFDGWNNRNCGQLHDSTEMEICKSEAIRYSNTWIQPIRLISLAVILTRAGLELSPKQLKKLKGVVPLLAFGPCVVEACTCAAATYFIFANDRIGIFMCFVAGFALAAVSPAVVVPGMLSLKRKRLGEAQGIPTLLIAASSIDDVLAISAYSIFLGIAVPAHEESNWIDYTSGVLGFVVGIIHGFVVGIFLHFIPAKDLKQLPIFRLLLLLLINISSMLFYERQELISGAGSVAVLVTSFIASFRWRSEKHWKKPMGAIEHHLAHIWTLVVPLLFGTIGREIDFSSESYTGIRIGKVFTVIAISLVLRCLTAFLVVTLAKLNFKERVFCMASWIPKATVQAALAPLVVTRIQESAIASTDPLLRVHGQIVVLIAVLAILITAPLGSVLIACLGPRLLRAPTEVQKINLDLEFPGGDPEESLLVISRSTKAFGKCTVDDDSCLNSNIESELRIVEMIDTSSGIATTNEATGTGPSLSVFK